MNDLQSRVYQPDPNMCCDRCVFGQNDHATWCSNNTRATIAESIADLDAKFPHLRGAEKRIATEKR